MNTSRVGQGRPMSPQGMGQYGMQQPGPYSNPMSPPSQYGQGMSRPMSPQSMGQYGQGRPMSPPSQYGQGMGRPMSPQSMGQYGQGMGRPMSPPSQYGQGMGQYGQGMGRRVGSAPVTQQPQHSAKFQKFAKIFASMGKTVPTQSISKTVPKQPMSPRRVGAAQVTKEEIADLKANLISLLDSYLQ